MGRWHTTAVSWERKAAKEVSTLLARLTTPGCREDGCSGMKLKSLWGGAAVPALLASAGAATVSGGQRLLRTRPRIVPALATAGSKAIRGLSFPLGPEPELLLLAVGAVVELQRRGLIRWPRLPRPQPIQLPVPSTPSTDAPAPAHAEQPS